MAPPDQVRDRLLAEVQEERRTAESTVEKGQIEAETVAAAVRRPLLWLLAADAVSDAPDQATLDLLVEKR